MNAVESQCRAWNMDVSDLARAIGRSEREIALAAVSARYPEIRSEILHYFHTTKCGMRSWEDLERLRDLRERRNMQEDKRAEFERQQYGFTSRDVPEKPITVLARGEGTLLFEHEGVFYVDTRKNGKLLKRRQVFNRREADIIFATESREGV